MSTLCFIVVISVTETCLVKSNLTLLLAIELVVLKVLMSKHSVEFEFVLFLYFYAENSSTID